MNNNNSKQQVRFAPTCKVTVLVDRTKGIEHKLWYSSDDVDDFKLYSTLYARLVREKIGKGSFDGKISNIIGLERLICKQNYSVRRAALKAVVFEEQAFQRLSREMRLRRGLGDVDSPGTNTRLASVAEENSRWARECAHVAGLALQSDLWSDIMLAKPEQRKRKSPIQQGSQSSEGDDADAETSFKITKRRPHEVDTEESSGGGATSPAVATGRPCHRGRCSLKFEYNYNIGEEADRTNEEQGLF